MWYFCVSVPYLQSHIICLRAVLLRQCMQRKHCCRRRRGPVTESSWCTWGRACTRMESGQSMTNRCVLVRCVQYIKVRCVCGHLLFSVLLRLFPHDDLQMLDTLSMFLSVLQEARRQVPESAAFFHFRHWDDFISKRYSYVFLFISVAGCDLTIVALFRV